MQTLITGYKGFIGSRLSKKIPNFIGLDKRDGDDLLTCELPDNVDCIYHLAAHKFVEESWNKPDLYMDNIKVVARLVKHYPNARIIHASSAAAIEPQSPYGFSKLAASHYLKIFHKDYINLVFPNIYGDGSGSVVDLFKGKDEVTIYGDGLAVRDYVHVDDIVEGLLKSREWEVGEYFMGDGTRTTVIRLASDKRVNFMPARNEIRESIVENTTPDWRPIINVFNYLND